MCSRLAALTATTGLRSALATLLAAGTTTLLAALTALSTTFMRAHGHPFVKGKIAPA